MGEEFAVFSHTNLEEIRLEEFADNDSDPSFFDRRDFSVLSSILTSFIAWIVTLSVLKSTIGLETMRKVPFDGILGDFNILLVMRNFLVDYIFLRLFSWSVSTICTVSLQRRLKENKTLARSTKTSRSVQYGYHTYDTIEHGSPVKPFYWILPHYSKRSWWHFKWLYKLFSLLSRKHALYYSHSDSTIMEALKCLENSMVSNDLEDPKHEIKYRKIKIEEDLSSDEEYSLYYDVNAVSAEDIKDAGFIEGRMLVGKIRKYNNRVHDLHAAMLLENDYIESYNSSLRKLKEVIKKESSNSQISSDYKQFIVLKRKVLEDCISTVRSEEIIYEKRLVEYKTQIEKTDERISIVQQQINECKRKKKLIEGQRMYISEETYQKWERSNIFVYKIFGKILKEPENVSFLKFKENLENGEQYLSSMIDKCICEIRKLKDHKEILTIEINTQRKELKNLNEKLKSYYDDFERTKKSNNNIETTSEARRNYNKEQEKDRFNSFDIFCRRIEKDEVLQMKQYELYNCNGNWKCLYPFKGGHKKSNPTLKLIYNRVKRSAGLILLGEIEAERVISTKRRKFNWIAGFFIMFLAILIRSFVDESMNANTTATTEKNVLVDTPVIGAGAWNCSYMDDRILYLARERNYSLQDEVAEEDENENETCLWDDRLEKIELKKQSLSVDISYDETSQVWKATEIDSNEAQTYSCKAQSVSISMLRDGLAPGGFLQICSNETVGSILLVQEKIMENGDALPQNTVFKSTSVEKYSSSWINNDAKISEKVSYSIGVRNITDIEILILDFIREGEVGRETVSRQVTIKVEQVNRVVTNSRILISVIGAVLFILIVALVVKYCNISDSGKINIRSEDSSMISTLYVSRTGLPVCNIVYPRLTPEIEVSDSNTGTKSINITSNSDYKNTLRLLYMVLADKTKNWKIFSELKIDIPNSNGDVKDSPNETNETKNESNKHEPNDEPTGEPTSEEPDEPEHGRNPLTILSKMFKSWNSYKDFSWEEIQGGAGSNEKSLELPDFESTCRNSHHDKGDKKA